MRRRIQLGAVVATSAAVVLAGTAIAAGRDAGPREMAGQPQAQHQLTVEDLQRMVVVKVGGFHAKQAVHVIKVRATPAVFVAHWNCSAKHPKNPRFKRYEKNRYGIIQKTCDGHHSGSFPYRHKRLRDLFVNRLSRIGSIVAASVGVAKSQYGRTLKVRASDHSWLVNYRRLHPNHPQSYPHYLVQVRRPGHQKPRQTWSDG